MEHSAKWKIEVFQIPEENLERKIKKGMNKNNIIIDEAFDKKIL